MSLSGEIPEQPVSTRPESAAQPSSILRKVARPLLMIVVCGGAVFWAGRSGMGHVAPGAGGGARAPVRGTGRAIESRWASCRAELGEPDRGDYRVCRDAGRSR